MATPLSISLKVTGLDQAKADLRQFAEQGKRAFSELERDAEQFSQGAATTDRALAGAANRVRALAASIDPLTANAIKYRAALTDIARLENTNNLETQHATQLRARLNAEYERTNAIIRQNSAVQQQHGQVVQATGQQTAISLAQSRFAVQQFGFQINDVVTSLASGQSPFKVLIQQSGQFVQAFQVGGGPMAVLRAFGAELAKLATPTTALIAGLTAVGGALLFLVNRAAEAEQSIRVFNVTLEAMNAGSLASAAALEKQAVGMRNLGLSTTDARKALNEIIATGLNPQIAAQVLRAGTNLSAALGGNQTQTLTQALTGGITAATDYAVKVGAMTARQALFNEELARSGQGGRALINVLDAITQHSKDMYEKGLSPSAKAMRDFKVAWGDAMDDLMNTRPIQIAVGGLADIARAISAIARGAADLKSTLAGMGAGAAGGAAIGGALGGPFGAVGGAAIGGTFGAIGGAGLAQQTNPTFYTPLPASGAGVVSEAQAMLGMNTRANASAIAGYIASVSNLDPQTTAWCAAFANAVLARQGLPGTGSNVATSFLNYGQAVGGEVLPGDILVQSRGRSAYQTGGHVGFATGATQLTDQGLMLEMISGNQGKAVAQSWINANEVVVRRATELATATAGAINPAGPAGQQSALAAGRLVVERQREAEVTRDVGLANAYLKAQQEAQSLAANKIIDQSQVASVAAGLYAAEVTKLRNEIANQTEATRREEDGLRSIADAYALSSKEGKIQEAIVKAETEAYNRFGSITNDQSRNFITQRTQQTIAIEKQNESLQNNRDLINQKDALEVLKLQTQLVGQNSDEIQRQVTLLQAKQEIEKNFPFLTEKEKENRIAAAAATADQVKALAQAQQAQQRLNDMWSSIGQTIQSTVGDAINSIFDPKKPLDFGKSLLTMFKSIGNTIIQSLLVRPLTGEILGAFGAPATTVNQFGTFGGASSIFSALGTANSINSMFGGSSLFGGGGLLGGVGSFLNNTIGPSLGFATAATPSLGSLIGIETSTLANIPGIAGAALGSTAGTAGSLFGMATLTSALPILGIVGALAGMFLPSLFKRKPPNQSAGGSIDLSQFQITGGFTGGNSQIDQAMAQAASQLQSFMDILKTTGGTLTGQLLLQSGVNTGVTLDYSNVAGFGSGRLSLGRDPAAAVRMIELALTRSLTGVSDTMQTVLNQISDPAALESAIAFANAYDDISEAAKDAFASVEKTTETIGPFTEAMDQINATFGALTEQANQFGLSLDPINAALAEATRRLQGDFGTALERALNEATGEGFLNAIQDTLDSYLADIAQSQAIGLGADPATQDLLAQVFSAQINAILEQLDSEQLDLVVAQFTGLNDVIVQLAQAAESTATDVQALSDQLGAALDQIQQYLDTLRATPSPLTSPEDALAAAGEQYAEQLFQAQQGNLEALTNITQYADQFIQAIEAYYASSAYGQELAKNIQGELEGLLGLGTVQDPTVVLLETISDQTDTLTETVSTGTDQTTQVISSTTQALMAANSAAAQAAIDQNNADTATLVGITNDTAAANIAANQASTATLIAGAVENTASLLAAGDAATTALIDQNSADAAALIEANTQSATAALENANVQTQQILDQNDLNSAALISTTQAKSDELLAQAQSISETALADNQAATDALIAQNNASKDALLAQATAASTDTVGAITAWGAAGVTATYDGANSIVQSLDGGTNTTAAYIAAYSNAVITQIGYWGTAGTTAIYDAADSIIRQIQNYVGAQIGQDVVLANNAITSNTGLTNSVLQAINTGVAGIIVTLQNWIGTQINNDTGLTNSLINVGATYSNAQVSAIYGAANSIIGTNATYANNQLANQDNWLSSINNWLGSIWNVESNYGQAAYNQRNEMIQLLFDIKEALRLMGQAPYAA